MKSLLAIGVLLALGMSSAYACGDTTCVKGNITIWSGSTAEARGNVTGTETLSFHEGLITARKQLGEKKDGTGYDVTIGTSGLAQSAGKHFSGASTFGEGGFLVKLPKTPSLHHPHH